MIPGPIKRLLRHIAVSYLELREARRSDPARVVWILGHMRSGSTLLMHLLSSNPEILGAGERNAAYATSDDLRRLAVDAAYHRRRFVGRHRYVVDQINHNRFLASEELLDHPRLFRIFLVREPAATIASMSEVLGTYYGTTTRESVDYYLDRLPALARYARAAADKSRSLFLTYEDLVTRPAAVLPCLSSFLGLKTPLSEQYELFGFTGKRGDPSARISSGRILGIQPRQPIELEPAVLDQVAATYSRCIRLLRVRCETPEVADSTVGTPTEEA